MMEFSVSKEAFVFLCSAAGGALIFLVYDLFRTIRRASGCSKLFVQVQDGAFWLIALGIMFYVIFTVNNGTVRFYEILGAALGAVLYGFLLSGLVLKILYTLLRLFSEIFKVFLKILLTPLVFLYNILYRYTCLLFRPFARFCRLIFRKTAEGVKRAGRMIKKK